MPINAFGGGVGTGKTYGVMEHVVLPAVAAGRFIITNIEGLNEQAIYDYVAKHFYKGKIICIGHIRCCDRNAPGEEDFFPGQDALDKAVPVPAGDAPKVVGGDLVIVDEATRYWPQDEKVKKSHAYFFREHRHFANEMGHTCDLVVIDPDLSMLVRALKGTILEISPVVRDQGVDIDLFQQVSSFVNIDGNSQPTLNKRELRTSLTVRDGEVVVIAGLDDMKEDDSRSGLSFLPFALAKSRSVRKSQLVLVMEVTRIDSTDFPGRKF